MLLDIDAGRQWVFMWGQLQAFRLDLWVKQEHWEKGQDPVRFIVVDRVSAHLWVSKLYPVLLVHIVHAVFSAQNFSRDRWKETSSMGNLFITEM